MTDQTQEQEDEMIEAAIQNANNMGAATDMFHPDYGWILVDGKPTPEGLDFFQEQLEPYMTLNKSGRA